MISRYTYRHMSSILHFTIFVSSRCHLTKMVVYNVYTTLNTEKNNFYWLCALHTRLQSSNILDFKMLLIHNKIYVCKFLYIANQIDKLSFGKTIYRITDERLLERHETEKTTTTITVGNKMK